MVAAEPLWRCSLCGDACHVSCFAAAHPQLPTVGAKLHALLDGKERGSGHSGGRGHSGRASPPRQRRRRRARSGEPGSSSMLGSSPSGGSSDDGERSGLLSPAAFRIDTTPALTEPSSAVSDSSAPEGLRRRRGSGSTGTPPDAAAAAVAAAANAPVQQAQGRSFSWLQTLVGAVSRHGSRSGAGAAAGIEGSSGAAAAGFGVAAAEAAAGAAAAGADSSGYSSDTESGGRLGGVGGDFGVADEKCLNVGRIDARCP